jgi:cell wall-associated NlpC family hydrolase
VPASGAARPVTRRSGSDSRRAIHGARFVPGCLNPTKRSCPSVGSRTSGEDERGRQDRARTATPPRRLPARSRLDPSPRGSSRRSKFERHAGWVASVVAVLRLRHARRGGPRGRHRGAERAIDVVEREIGGLRGEVAALEGPLARSQSRLRKLEEDLARKTRELARARRQPAIADEDARIVGTREGRSESHRKARSRLAAARAAQTQTLAQLAREWAAIEARLAERERLHATVTRRCDQSRHLRVSAERTLSERRAPYSRQRRTAAAAGSPVAGAFRTASEHAWSGACSRARSPARASAGRPSRRAQMIAIAMRYLSVPYKCEGASLSTGLNCSGFTSLRPRVKLPHGAAQHAMGHARFARRARAGRPGLLPRSRPYEHLHRRR